MISSLRSFLDRKGINMLANNREHHHTGRIGWMRAAVLGANDGILSTSSLVLGVAAAQGTHPIAHYVL
jgi:VIT1/CCC1 family predicted Fe2+/Mn2+ transporter